MTVTAPEPLDAHHDIVPFASGVESLDHWLKRRLDPMMLMVTLSDLKQAFEQEEK